MDNFIFDTLNAVKQCSFIVTPLPKFLIHFNPFQPIKSLELSECLRFVYIWYQIQLM